MKKLPVRAHKFLPGSEARADFDALPSRIFFTTGPTLVRIDLDEDKGFSIEEPFANHPTMGRFAKLSGHASDDMKRFLLFNLLVLAVFCAVWYWVFYMSARWMRIIDLGAPWSWFGALCVASYAVSFVPLRQRSKAVLKSFIGPAITVPAFWLWVESCHQIRPILLTLM